MGFSQVMWGRVGSGGVGWWGLDGSSVVWGWVESVPFRFELVWFSSVQVGSVGVGEGWVGLGRIVSGRMGSDQVGWGRWVQIRSG